MVNKGGEREREIEIEREWMGGVMMINWSTANYTNLDHHDQQAERTGRHIHL